MNAFTRYALAAFGNAFVCCAGIAFLVSRWTNLNSKVKVVITFVVYAMLAFVMSAGGNSIFALDMATFNTVLFLLYVSGGLCSCIMVYVYFERKTLGEKAAKNKKGKK